MSLLVDELGAEPPWMYPWEVDGRTARILSPTLPLIHETRARMMEPRVRAALAAGGTAIDLGCSEGWFAHRLLDWGASQVVGVDVRATNVRRAELVRDHYGIPADRLRFEQASVYDVSPEQLGTFDVVLCLGLIYHLEDPIGALRIARALTRTICVVETQAARSSGGSHTWGTAGEYLTTESAWLTRVESSDDQQLTTLASFGDVVSLVPNRPALLEAMRAAGFGDLAVLESDADGDAQYTSGDRLVVVGYA